MYLCAHANDHGKSPGSHQTHIDMTKLGRQLKTIYILSFIVCVTLCRRCVCEQLQGDALNKGMAAAQTTGATAAVQAAAASDRHEVGSAANHNVQPA